MGLHSLPRSPCALRDHLVSALRVNCAAARGEGDPTTTSRCRNPKPSRGRNNGNRPRFVFLSSSPGFFSFFVGGGGWLLVITFLIFCIRGMRRLLVATMVTCPVRHVPGQTRQPCTLGWVSWRDASLVVREEPPSVVCSTMADLSRQPVYYVFAVFNDQPPFLLVHDYPTAHYTHETKLRNARYGSSKPAPSQSRTGPTHKHFLRRLRLAPSKH